MKISNQIICWHGKCDSDGDTDPYMYSLWAACWLLHSWKNGLPHVILHRRRGDAAAASVQHPSTQSCLMPHVCLNLQSCKKRPFFFTAEL